MPNRLLTSAEVHEMYMKEQPAIGYDEDTYRRKYDPTYTVPPITKAYDRPLPKDADRFIIVAAQNATPVVPEWWALLNTIAADKGAELLVIPLRYKNATSIWTASQRNAEWWAPEVQPYLWNVRLQLNKHLTVMADMPIQPTNGNPLGRTESLSGISSAIFAHPKLQMKTVPVPSSRMAKLMTTTGVCTKENYVDTGLGIISQFHHSLSAVYVELDGDKFYLTQLHYSKADQSCTDLDTKYTVGKVASAPRALALVAGDMHVRFLDTTVHNARMKLLEQVEPQHWIFHDTLDSHATTPHHIKHPIILQAIEEAGMDDVRAEADEALGYIQRYGASKDRTAVIVPSNHDDMLTRWVEREDWRTMSDANADFYLELARKMKAQAHYSPIKGVELPDAFGLLAKEREMKNVIVLDRGESFALAGVELGMHGDLGPNGTRGSRQNLRRIGVKSIIGHSHSPGIDEGCYQTGTSSYLRLEYNHGASGWLNADVLLNADGKRQVIVYIDGRYRAGV